MAVDLRNAQGRGGLRPARGRRRRGLGARQLRRLPVPRRAAEVPTPPAAARRRRARRAVARGGGGGDDAAGRVLASSSSRASPTSCSRSPSPSTTAAGSGSPRRTRTRIHVPPEKAQRPHPDLRGHRRRRPFRHPQGLRRQAEPRQRRWRSASAASGSARPRTCCSSPTRTATTRPTGPRRSCSTAGATRTRTRRSTRSPGARTAGSTAATASSPTRRVGKPGTPDAERIADQRRHLALSPDEAHVRGLRRRARATPGASTWTTHGQAFVDRLRHPAPVPHDPGRPLPAPGRAALQPVHLRRHQDDRRPPPLRRRQPARRQRPLRQLPAAATPTPAR